MDIEEKKDKKIDKKQKKKFFCIFLIILLLGIFYLLKKSDILTGTLSNDAVIGMLPGTSKEELLAEMQKEVNSSQFKFEINSDVTLKDNIMNLELQNPPSNFFNMKVEIKLTDTNNTIYKSDLIEPNQYIKDAKVKKNIAKGKYDAIAYLTAYNPKTKQVEGKVEVEIVINSI